MGKTINEFNKSKEFLVCIDSDGCAIDSMTIKHVVAFGPAFIKTFKLEKYERELLDEWNRINLYSLTRGINRFKGLNLILHYCDSKLEKIDNILDFDAFINDTKAFSNDALLEYKASHPSKLLDLCLEWSNLTNKMIKEIKDEDIVLFKNVKESIKNMASLANIAVVSSANFEAIWKEWDRLGILEYVDCFCSQLDGTKANCIEKLLEKGFDNKKVIMFGDGPGDLDSAKENNVFFYPIVCKKEDGSWEKSKDYFKLFLEGEFKDHQEELIKVFEENLR